MPVAVGEAGSNAARTASEAGGFAVDGFAAGAALDFLAAAVAFDDLAVLWLADDLELEALDEDLLDVFAEGLLLLDVEFLAVLFLAFGAAWVSFVAACTDAGSAMQQASVDRSATTRRTVRPCMGMQLANRTASARVNAAHARIPLRNPCVAGCSMCGGVVAGTLLPGCYGQVPSP